MNRGEMRALLKDLLQEPELSVDQFSIPRLDSLLNQGYLYVEKQILRINPEAFLAADNISQTDGTNIYPTPPGIIAIRKVIRRVDGKRVSIKAPGYMDVTYGPLVGSGFVAGTQGVARASAPNDYSPWGRYIRVGACPDNTLANAFSIQYVPSLTMANDSDIAQVPLELHDAIVAKAWTLGIRPNADITQKAAAAKGLEEALEGLPDMVGFPVDGAVQVLPDFDTTDGFYGDSGRDTANDVSFR